MKANSSHEQGMFTWPGRGEDPFTMLGELPANERDIESVEGLRPPSPQDVHPLLPARPSFGSADRAGISLFPALLGFHGRYIEAADIATRFVSGADVEALIAFGEWEEQLQGNWAAADSAQRDALWDLAFTKDRQGSAGAWATLYLLGETDTLPSAFIPPAYRAAFAGRERTRQHAESRMAAYPNPAKDRVMITLPEGVDHGDLQVFDAQGRMVHSATLQQAKAFVELDARAWTEGLYFAKLTFEGYEAGECKFTIAR